MRCLTLARALREKGAECRFVTRVLPGHLAAQISAEGFKVTLLPAPTGQAPEAPPAHAAWAGVHWEVDAAETHAALGNSLNLLVVDHYSFDARWEKAACPKDTKIMVVDDLADRRHECDILLDQNFGRAALDYRGLVPRNCTCLIGPRYALLRPEFAQARANTLAERSSRELRHLLITMGGVDPKDATTKVLRSLRSSDLPNGLRITVVMGSHAPALKRVRALTDNMPSPIEVAVDVNDMAACMAAADLAIGAAGSTTWERCAVGLPTIIVRIADNQALIARALSDAGAAMDPGAVTEPEFARNLQAMLVKAQAQLSAMSERAADICDGEGATRVVSVLQMKGVA